MIQKNKILATVHHAMVAVLINEALLNYTSRQIQPAALSNRITQK